MLTQSQLNLNSISTQSQLGVNTELIRVTNLGLGLNFFSTQSQLNTNPASVNSLIVVLNTDLNAYDKTDRLAMNTFPDSTS